MSNINERAKEATYKLLQLGIIQPLLRRIENGKKRVTYKESGKKGINFRTIETNIKIIADAGAAEFGMTAADLGADYGSEINTTGKNISIEGNTLKLFYRGCEGIEKHFPELF